MHVSVHHPKVNVPVLWWRSVGHTHNAFVMETLIDELAARADMDPIAYRRNCSSLKQEAPAARSARKATAGWRKRLPGAHAFGIMSRIVRDRCGLCGRCVDRE